MKNHISPLAIAVFTAGIAAGCSTLKEQHVSLAQTSAPARATIERETVGGMIGEIVREFEHNQIVYDIEGNVGGKHLEWLVADSDGAILGTETEIETSKAPMAVLNAAEKYFDNSSGLLIMKGVEYGETHYEVEGLKNGRKVEVTYDSTGKRIE